MSYKLPSLSVNNFPLVLVFKKLSAPQLHVFVCAGEVKEEKEILENSKSDKAVVKRLYFPWYVVVGFYSLLPPLPLILLLSR